MNVSRSQSLSPKLYDDDDRPKRTGTVFTASLDIITAMIGSGVLSLAWANAQLGWIAGPTMIFMFSFVTYYTSTLLASCYRSGDKRNYTYMDAVSSNLGGVQVNQGAALQYLTLFGTAIGYYIEASTSMAAIERSNCFHTKGHEDHCKVSSISYMIAFGVLQVILSQIPKYDKTWWLSVATAVLSFTFTSIGLGLGISKVAENGQIRGSLTGVSIGEVTEMQKVWRSFQALGEIAFAYSISLILIEIQDTIKSPPSEYKTMKKASMISVSVTTIFYMLCACFGYAAFGDTSPSNLLIGFGFYNPYGLLDIANAAIVVHHVFTYQVYCRPLFAFIERVVQENLPESAFSVINKEITIPVSPYKLNLFTAKKNFRSNIF